MNLRAEQSSVVRSDASYVLDLNTVLGKTVFASVVVVLAEEKGIRAPGVGAPWGIPCIQA